MDRVPLQMTPIALIGHGFASLLRPPFRTLWLVVLLIALAAPSVTEPGDDFSLVAMLLLAVVTFVLELATVLAAGGSEADPSADLWIRRAFGQRGLWRFVLASILTDLSVGLGLLVFLVGGFIVAGIVGLAPQAAVLERRPPLQALRRSAELTKPARGTIAIVYGLLVLIPTMVAVVPYVVGYEPGDLVERLRGVAASTMSMAAWIALTRAFVELGGGKDVPRTPPSPEASRPES